MLHFTVTELSCDDLASVWPLVRTVAPELSLEEWQESARQLIDRGGHVLGVAAELRSFLGVATYEAVKKPRVGKVLQVDMLVTFELTRRAPIRQILCEELERLAPLLGCTGMAVSVGSRSYVAHKAKALHSTLEPNGRSSSAFRGDG